MRGRGGGGFRGGGMRGGGGRISGGLGGSRGGSVRGLGSSSLGGSAGRGGRGAIPTPGASRGGGGLGGLGGGGLGGGGLSGLGGGARRPAPAPPPRRGPGFGTGMAVGMGTGMLMGGRRRRGFGMGGGWGRGRRRGMGMMPMGGGMGGGMGRRGGGCGSGCSSIILLIIIVILVFSVISWLGNFNSPQNWADQGLQQGTHGAVVDPFPAIIPSTIIREPLPAGSAMETGSLFTDHLGWINNQSELTVGMRNFHQATGVRPHLYLVGEINGNTHPTDQQLLDFANTLYGELFDDEAHVLLVFFENYEHLYGMAVVPGNQARSVMDQEAQDILMDFVGRYYYSDLDEEALFSRVFDGAGQRIMYVPAGPPEPVDNRPIWITIIVVAGVLLLVFMLFRWWQKKQEQKNREFEETERILSQPLETMGSQHDAASQLAQQYQDNDTDQ